MSGLLPGCSQPGKQSSTSNSLTEIASLREVEDESVEPEGLIESNPVRLQIGGSQRLYPKDGYTVENNSETSLCSTCPNVRAGTIWARVVPLEDGNLWLDTRGMDSSADTVIRIKRTNRKKTCDDDISATDKRSEITKWKVKAGTDYWVMVGIKAGTTVYPLEMKVYLKDTNSVEGDPCYYVPHLP
jgi:hypothetical protein